MKDTEINIAIAEACGIAWEQSPDGWWDQIKPTKMTLGLSYGGMIDRIPSYTTDLNAMHGAEKVMTGDDRKVWEYVRQLIATTHGRMYPDRISSWTLSHANAAQRAEAFLRTIGKWKE